MGCSKVRSKTVLQFNVQKRYCWILVMHFTLKLNLRAVRMAGNHLEVLLILRRKESMEDDIPDLLQSTTWLMPSSIVHIDTLCYFLDQWKSITFYRLCLIWLKSHCLQLRCIPLLVSNFKQFDIKSSLAHHPVIQKENDGPLDYLLVNLAYIVIMSLWYLSV